MARDAETPRSLEQPDTATDRAVLAGGCADPDVPVVHDSDGWPDQVSVPGRQIAPVLVLTVVTDSAQATHFLRMAPA